MRTMSQAVRTYSTWHYATDTGVDDLPDLDSAVRWSREMLDPTSDDEGNAVGIYVNGEVDRVAVVYRDIVVVNEGHGTSRWPAGFHTVEVQA